MHIDTAVDQATGHYAAAGDNGEVNGRVREWRKAVMTPSGSAQDR
jgi:hypothetical protein